MHTRSGFFPSLSWQVVDKLGVWTSALCFVHCLLTPVVLSMSAVLAHVLPGEERTHRTLAIVVALLGALSLLSGFRKHGRRIIFVLMGVGMSLIIVAAWFGDQLPSHLWEVGVTFLGSSAMIAAHRLNHTFCRSCDCTRQSSRCGSV